MNGAGEAGLQGVAIERSRAAPTAASEDPRARIRMTEGRLGAANERIAPSAAIAQQPLKLTLFPNRAASMTALCFVQTYSISRRAIVSIRWSDVWAVIL